LLEYERDLDEDIESDLTGQFQKLIRAVLACGRDESGNVDKALAKSDAQVRIIHHPTSRFAASSFPVPQHFTFKIFNLVYLLLLYF
jgi:hypothetical protein